jgi:phospholipid-binding lipoprotein MlaA
MILSGCATSPGRTPINNDPWQTMNRGIYSFNDGLDRIAVQPVAKGYQAVTPTWVRARVSLFFINIGYPVTMVNQLLQGKPKLFAQDTGHFLTNTVFGLGGLFDVADKMGMPEHHEDFGQTLAVWGVPSGPYVMLPLLGPSTLRDAPGRIPDFFLAPLSYADITLGEYIGVRATEEIDIRAQLLSTESVLQGAFDRYGVIRDAWLQRREYQIFDGDPPVDAPELYDDEPEQSQPVNPSQTESK